MQPVAKGALFTKAQFQKALWAHVALIALIAALAYAGGLRSMHWLNVRYMDKVLHFAMVGGVAFWIAKGWDDPRFIVGALSIPLAVALPLVLFSVEEAMQAISPNRTADIYDWLANSSGLVTFWLIARLRWPTGVRHNG